MKMNCSKVQQIAKGEDINNVHMFFAGLNCHTYLDAAGSSEPIFGMSPWPFWLKCSLELFWSRDSLYASSTGALRS